MRLDCPRCRGSMEEGFVLDRGDHSMPDLQAWIEGVPERSRWTGIKTKGRQSYPVKTYRCDRCGYLESYAPATEGG
jgi:hypothetical protein